MESMGDRIKRLRESRKMTQEELGKAVGTTKQTIFKYETDKIGNIPYNRLLEIAKALDAVARSHFNSDDGNSFVSACSLRSGCAAR